MNISSINSAADAQRQVAAELSAGASPGAPKESAAATEARKRGVAARQFEAIIIRQLLAPAIDPLMSGGMTGGKSAGGGGSVYSYLMTDTLANSITQGGGLGLSKILETQLSPKGAGAAAHAAAAYRSQTSRTP